MTDLQTLVRQTSNPSILKMQQRLHKEVVVLGKQALEWKAACEALQLALETERLAAQRSLKMEKATDTASPFDIPVMQIVEGDIVRVKDPNHYIRSFAAKIKDRDALVLWVGPTPNGMFKRRVKVRFLKRNGRGKEFEELMHLDDLCRHERHNAGIER